MSLIIQVKEKAPKLLEGGLETQKKLVLEIIDRTFMPPYHLTDTDLGALDELVGIHVKNPRRRAQLLCKVLTALQTHGLAQSGLPTIPPPESHFSVIPTSTLAVGISGKLQALVDALTETRQSDLENLTDEALCVLIFVALVTEGAVCAEIAIHTICTSLTSSRRGMQWLWINSSPASESSFSALYLRPTLRKLIAAAISRWDLAGKSAPLLLPPSLHSVQKLPGPLAHQHVRAWIAQSLKVFFSGSNALLGNNLWRVPAASSTAKHPLSLWLSGLTAEQKKSLTSFTAIDKAAKFLWYMRDLPPFAIRILYMPVLPSASEFNFSNDKKAGYRKRDLEFRYQHDPGVPPAVNVESVSTSTEADNSDSEQVERIDPTEDTPMPLPNGHWSREAVGHVTQFVALMAELRLKYNPTKQFEAYAQAIGELTQKFKANLPESLPATSTLMLLLDWISHRFLAKTLNVVTLRQYLGRFAYPFLFSENVPMDMGDWTDDEVYTVLSEMLTNSRAASTKFSATGLFANFIAFCKATTRGAILEGVELVRGRGDIDFERRIHIPTDRKFWRSVEQTLSRRGLPAYNRPRAALALLLMGGLGLRAVEAFSIEYSDIAIVGNDVIVRIKRSKTRAGARQLLAHCFLEKDRLDLLVRLLSDIHADRLNSDGYLCRLLSTPHQGGSLPAELSFHTSRAKVCQILRECIHGSALVQKLSTGSNNSAARRPKSVLTDLHSLRHMFVTKWMLKLLQRIAAKDDSVRAEEFVHLLKVIGHRSFATLAVHYFHAGESMRMMLLQR